MPMVTIEQLKVHATLRGLEFGLAAHLILSPWLMRFGAGRTADEFRGLADVAGDEGPDQTQVPDHSAEHVGGPRLSTAGASPATRAA